MCSKFWEKYIIMVPDMMGSYITVLYGCRRDAKGLTNMQQWEKILTRNY